MLVLKAFQKYDIDVSYPLLISLSVRAQFCQLFDQQFELEILDVLAEPAQVYLRHERLVLLTKQRRMSDLAPKSNLLVMCRAASVDARGT